MDSDDDVPLAAIIKCHAKESPVKVNIYGGEFRCDTCHKEFSSSEKLASHAARHDIAGKPYACFVCSIGYRSSQSLNKHLSTVHRNEDIPKIVPQHLCTLCGQIFELKDKLNRHLKENHIVVVIGEIQLLDEFEADEELQRNKPENNSNEQSKIDFANVEHFECDITKFFEKTNEKHKSVIKNNFNIKLENNKNNDRSAIKTVGDNIVPVKCHKNIDSQFEENILQSKNDLLSEAPEPRKSMLLGYKRICEFVEPNINTDQFSSNYPNTKTIIEMEQHVKSQSYPEKTANCGNDNYKAEQNNHSQKLSKNMCQVNSKVNYKESSNSFRKTLMRGDMKKHIPNMNLINLSTLREFPNHNEKNGYSPSTRVLANSFNLDTNNIYYSSNTFSPPYPFFQNFRDFQDRRTASDYGNIRCGNGLNGVDYTNQRNYDQSPLSSNLLNSSPPVHLSSFNTQVVKLHKSKMEDSENKILNNQKNHDNIDIVDESNY